MILDLLSRLPDGMSRLIWTVIIVLMTFLAGRIAARLTGRWLLRWVGRTKLQWDEIVVRALRRSLPLWSVLLGLYVAVDLWQLEPVWSRRVAQGLFIAGWLSVTVVFADVAGRLTMLYGSQFASAVPMTSITHHIVKLSVILLGTLMILHGLGVSVTPLLTALGVGGLAVALALQDTLSNLFAGFYLSMTRQVRIGDYVKLDGGQEGYVADIGWRATQIRMLPNNMVIVPNSKLAQAVIINYYFPTRDLAVLVEVGVAYDSDLARVERVTCEVARQVMREVPGGVPEFEPFIRFHTFGDHSINFTVILRAGEFVEQYLIKHEFIKRLHTRYQDEGIEIPFPVRTIHTKAASGPSRHATV